MNRLVPLVSAAILAGAASAADVTIVNPRLKWLFGGFGFQNAESRLTALMSDEFRDERAIKCFRELAPSYSRVYVGLAGELRESLDRFADYYESAKAVYKPDMKYNKWGVFRWSDVRRDYGPNPTYFTLGMMSRFFRKGASVLGVKTDDSKLRVVALENSDGVLVPENGGLSVELPATGMVFVTTDYRQREVPEVKGERRTDDGLTWEPAGDPDHCYYRVYEDGRQVASTVATSFKRIRKDARYEVCSVDRWGNCRKESK